jgi:hypothetical protein
MSRRVERGAAECAHHGVQADPYAQHGVQITGGALLRKIDRRCLNRKAGLVSIRACREGTFVKARIFLADDVLIADCDNGLRLRNADAVQLADLLWANDVTAPEVFMIDWHQDAERAPLSGQRVAIYQRLRLHEQSGD